ncbi:MAG: GNAT family N-acetyltransferase [Burkholderiales bacterium]
MKHAKISPCTKAHEAEILAIINDAAQAYRGVIPADRWHEPYLPAEALRAEMNAGVAFWGFTERERLLAVMGLQYVADVALIRHAYTRTAARGRGIGGALLEHLKREAKAPLLVGTWKAATWAVRFYQQRGFTLTNDEEKTRLLKRYWNIPERQVEESVVLRR